MELTWNNIGPVLGIMTFAAGLINYIVVKPLQASINSLKETVTELKLVIAGLSEEQKCIDKRLVAVEESAKSAHKRLDGMENHHD